MRISSIYVDNVKFTACIHACTCLTPKQHAGSVLSTNLVANMEKEKESNLLVHGYPVSLQLVYKLRWQG